jgi:hypothetical protein
MEFWFSTERQIAARNIGPVRGEDSFLGKIHGSGLYLVRGPNTSGKSTIGRLLAKMDDQDLLRQSVQITDGEDSAFLEMEPRRVTFTRSPAGDMRMTVEGAEAPPVEEMPAAIETLVHADHLSRDNPEGRARHRLAALLSYAPIETSMEHLTTLLAALADLPAITAEMRETWLELAAEAAAGSKRVRIEGLRTRAEVRDWIIASPKRKGGLLDDHDLLTEICNATGNTGEKAAEAQRRRLAKIQGRLDGALQAAARQIEWPAGEEGKLRTLLEQEHDLPALTATRDGARLKLTELETSAGGRRAGEARRERLAATRGEKPEAAVAVAEAEVAEVGEKLKGAVVAAYAELDEWQAALRDQVFSDDGKFRWGQGLAGEADRAHKLVSKLAALLATRPEDSDLGKAAQQRLAAAREALAAWERVGEQLAEPIEGAAEAEVEAARTTFAEAESAVNLAKAAAAYQAVAAELAAALDLARRLDELAAAYRTAAKDSWSFLGQIITEALKLPWLQVDGLDVYLGYVEGKLNQDPELIAQAQAAAEAALDKTSPVSLPRFIMEKIREAPAVEWRSIDDEARVSTGELHEACLAVFLERLAPGSIRWVPWYITSALDPERLKRFDQAVRGRECVLLGEEPRRQGDPQGIWLERVAGRFGEVAS